MKEIWSVIKDPNSDGYLVAHIDRDHFEISGSFDDPDEAQEYADNMNCAYYTLKEVLTEMFAEEEA